MQRLAEKAHEKSPAKLLKEETVRVVKDRGQVDLGQMNSAVGLEQ